MSRWWKSLFCGCFRWRSKRDEPAKQRENLPAARFRPAAVVEPRSVAEEKSAALSITTVEVQAADTFAAVGEKTRRRVPSSDQLASDGPDRVLVRMSADDDKSLDDAKDAAAIIRDGQETITHSGEDEEEDEEEESLDDDSWYANRNRIKYVEEWLHNNAVANPGRYDDQRPWWTTC